MGQYMVKGQTFFSSSVLPRAAHKEEAGTTTRRVHVHVRVHVGYTYIPLVQTISGLSIAHKSGMGRGRGSRSVGFEEETGWVDQK